jgi:hypothetical protein
MLENNGIGLKKLELFGLKGEKGLKWAKNEPA